MKNRVYLYNKVSEKGYIPFFVVAPEHIDDPLNYKNEDKFQLLLDTDQGYIYDGKTFIKRSKETTVFFELQLLTEVEFNNLKDSFKKATGNDIPSGDANDFLECYVKSLGFEDFDDFYTKFNSYLKTNKNKR